MKGSKPWKPFASNCCSVDDKTIFTRHRKSQSDVSNNGAPLPLLRRISISDISTSSSNGISEELMQNFCRDLFDFKLSELRHVTQNFARGFLLGEGGFGKVYKGYLEENIKGGFKAQAVAVKFLNIQGQQGHREWLVSLVMFITEIRSELFLSCMQFLSVLFSFSVKSLLILMLTGNKLLAVGYPQILCVSIFNISSSILQSS